MFTFKALLLDGFKEKVCNAIINFYQANLRTKNITEIGL